MVFLCKHGGIHHTVRERGWGMYGRCSRVVVSPYVSLIIPCLCPKVVLGWSLWLNGAVVSVIASEFGDV